MALCVMISFYVMQPMMAVKKRVGLCVFELSALASPLIIVQLGAAAAAAAAAKERIFHGSAVEDGL